MSDGERCAECPIKEAPRKGRRLRGADELAREIAKAPAVAADVLRGRITVDQAERRIHPEKYDIKKARKRRDYVSTYGPVVAGLLRRYTVDHPAATKKDYGLIAQIRVMDATRDSARSLLQRYPERRAELAVAVRTLADWIENRIPF